MHPSRDHIDLVQRVAYVTIEGPNVREGRFSRHYEGGDGQLVIMESLQSQMLGVELVGFDLGVLDPFDLPEADSSGFECALPRHVAKHLEVLVDPRRQALRVLVDRPQAKLRAGVDRWVYLAGRKICGVEAAGLRMGD